VEEAFQLVAGSWQLSLLWSFRAVLRASLFPALDAKAAGFKVYAVMDASGDPSELVSRTTLARLAQAGETTAVRSDTHNLVCSVHFTFQSL